MQFKRENKDLYSLSELSSLTSNGVIDCGITIRGEQLTSLTGVYEVKGSVGLCNCLIETLDQLEFVRSDFWISATTYQSNLKTLGKLKHVEGDCRLRYSNVEDLGELMHVGGTLSLRDTPINGLCKLNFVGGDLFLPMRLKGRVDLTRIKICGKIKYWNDTNISKAINKSELELVNISNIPRWRYADLVSGISIAVNLSTNKVSFNKSNFPSLEHSEFYEKYSSAFNDGSYFDLKGNNMYAFMLHNNFKVELLELIKRRDPIKVVKRQFELLRSYYPECRDFPWFDAISVYEEIGDYENAFKLKVESETLSIMDLAWYELHLSRCLFDSNLLFKRFGNTGFTEIVQKDIALLKQSLKHCVSLFLKEKGREFLDLFFLRERSPNRVVLYPNEHYEQFYDDQESFQENIDLLEIYYDYSDPVTPVVYGAIFNVVKNLKRNAENDFRDKKGLPLIGEGWVSETNLFYEISEAFINHIVVHHGKPKWLGRQHVDIYFPFLNIAIEYQGKQHYEPVEFFGGEQAFRNNQRRDDEKRKKCISNSCHLICVDPGYVLTDVVLEIKRSPNFLS